jgi:hypothetical protein
MTVAAPDRRFNPFMLWAVGTIGLVLMASVFDSWTNGERDAFKHGWHSCKEGIPPNGTGYEDDNECEAYYRGFWEALETKKATAAAALASGLGAWHLFRTRV